MLRVDRSVGSDASVFQDEPSVSETPQQRNHLRPFPSVGNSGVRHRHGVCFLGLGPTALPAAHLELTSVSASEEEEEEGRS